MIIPKAAGLLCSGLDRFVVASDGEAIVRITADRSGAVGGVPDALCHTAVSQINEYLEGTRTAFDFPIAYDGSEFERSVWEAAREICLV